MPPPEKEEKPLPRPKEKPKPPKPKHKTGPEPKPRREHAESHWTPGGGAGTLPPDPLSCGASCSGPCSFLPHCSEPPPAPPATVHIRSSRLPTPLIALSASLLVFSAALLVALLVHRLVRRRRRQRRLARGAAAVHDEEEGGHQVLAGAVAEAVSDGEDADGGGVHHVWYIRTKGLDERAIAAIAAVVYDAKNRGGGACAVDDGGGCAVCLADFRDGETLRLLPRCGHAFHRGCIDTWLRAHVNCPLCRAPVQVACAGAAAAAPGAATATSAAPGGEPERNLGVPRRTEDAERGGLVPERAVRRAASMVALPRRAWPDVSSFRAPTSSSGREGDMTGLGKIMRLLKFPDATEMAGMGPARSVSFSAGSCQGLPTRSELPSADGVSSDEAPR